MRIYMTDPAILRLLLFFLRQVKQQVKSAKIGVAVNDGLQLLI